jgi:hypothetical protein
MMQVCICMNIDPHANSPSASEDDRRTERMATLDEAVHAKERVQADILGQPGVTGIDVGLMRETGTEKPVIRIYVADKQKAPPLPNEVDGVPVVVIERRFELH